MSFFLPYLSDENDIGNWKSAWVIENILTTIPYEINVPDRFNIKKGNPIRIILDPRFLIKFAKNNANTKTLAELSILDFSNSKDMEKTQISTQILISNNYIDVKLIKFNIVFDQ